MLCRSVHPQECNQERTGIRRQKAQGADKLRKVLQRCHTSSQLPTNPMSPIKSQGSPLTSILTLAAAMAAMAAMARLQEGTET